MTARVALSCDGTVWPAGYACGQATPVGSPRDGAQARTIAHRTHAWRAAVDTRGGLLDLCPRCATLAAVHPERGARLLPVTAPLPLGGAA